MLEKMLRMLEMALTLKVKNLDPAQNQRIMMKAGLKSMKTMVVSKAMMTEVLKF